MSDAAPNPKVLLVISGGIAAYKACELVRLIRKGANGVGGEVTCVLTKGGAQFVTPMTLAALSENPVYTDVFDLKQETEMGHIQLSRESDLVVVCPASANLCAKMAAGMADDLATTVLLATDTPVMIVPAMNVRMWEHPATQRNIATLRDFGVEVLDPDQGAMACGEFGYGRLPEPEVIWSKIAQRLGMDSAAPAAPAPTSAPAAPPPSAQACDPSRSDQASPTSHTQPLSGRHVLVTAGPTWEAIDPVRYIANRSSGQQGFAIAAAAADMGAQVTLIAGPVALETPPGTQRIDVESADQMAAAVEAALPADIAVMVAAVADWKPAEYHAGKLKKRDAATHALALHENPDILANLSAAPQRPALVVGFAAETEDVLTHASAKRTRKGCDWIIANDVSGDVMGGDRNAVHILSEQGLESLPDMSKTDVATALVERMTHALNERQGNP